MENTTFQILNLIGVWLASIGTVSAVITSLYLAKRDSRVNLYVAAGYRIMFGEGIQGKPEYCSIHIVNKGFRRATICNVGWRVGIFRKKYAIQQIDRQQFSSPMPIELGDGQEAKYLIPLVNPSNKHNWIDEFTKDYLSKKPKFYVKTIRLQVYTTVGKTFTVKIEKGLSKKLIEYAEKHLTKY